MRSLIGMLGALGLQFFLVVCYVGVLLAIKYFVANVILRKAQSNQ